MSNNGVDQCKSLLGEIGQTFSQNATVSQTANLHQSSVDCSQNSSGMKYS